MYRTIRTTGQKCWFRVNVGNTQRAEQVAVVAAREAQTGPVESTVGTCVAAPTGPAPRNTQWRYRIDLGTHQRCWRLSRVVATQTSVRRTRTSSSGGSKQIERDNLRALRSVSDAQASLFESSGTSAGSAANAGHEDLPEGAPSRAQVTTFESRWMAPAEFDRPMDAAIHQEMPAVAPDDSEYPVPDVAKFQHGRISVVNSVRMSGLLIATVASIAIATGLYASINGSAASIRWIRGRASTLRPRKNVPDLRLSPPRDTTIADILERLNKEDDLTHSGPRRLSTSEAEPDRFAIPE